MWWGRGVCWQTRGWSDTSVTETNTNRAGSVYRLFLFTAAHHRPSRTSEHRSRLPLISVAIYPVRVVHTSPFARVGCERCRGSTPPHSRGMRRSFKFATRGINLDANAICLGLTWPVPMPVLCTPNITLVCTLWSPLLNNAGANFKHLSVDISYLANVTSSDNWIIRRLSYIVYKTTHSLPPAQLTPSIAASYFYLTIVLRNSQISSRFLPTFNGDRHAGSSTDISNGPYLLLLIYYITTERLIITNMHNALFPLEFHRKLIRKYGIHHVLPLLLPRLSPLMRVDNCTSGDIFPQYVQNEYVR